MQDEVNEGGYCCLIHIRIDGHFCIQGHVFFRDRRILPHNWLWSFSNIALECRAYRKLVKNFLVNASYCDLCHMNVLLCR